tara:strand:+ start:363 stop:590 length:228 start_codon:yes stop_codon:yes gene_type:complete
MSKFNLLLLSIIYLILSITNTYAYLDPGTGSIILQAIIGFIAASVATISVYWTKFKLIISKILRKKNKEKNIKND